MPHDHPLAPRGRSDILTTYFAFFHSHPRNLHDQQLRLLQAQPLLVNVDSRLLDQIRTQSDIRAVFPCSEYPIVDGPLSVTSYVNALDQSYSTYLRKVAKKQAAANGHSNGTNGHSAPITDASAFDYLLFHSCVFCRPCCAV